MDIETAESFFTLFDRIIDPTASPDDLLATVHNIRQHFADEAPKIVIKKLVILGTDVGDQLKSLQETNEELNAKLQQTVPVPVDGFYSMSDFQSALAAKRGQTYGYKIDYIKASKSGIEGVRPVKNEEIQGWQKSGKVPDWAYEQIGLLVFPTRKGSGKPRITWRTTDYEYLVRLHLANPSESNASLAQKCSEHFGREITENAVKGALDRKRKTDARIPPKRPMKAA